MSTKQLHRIVSLALVCIALILVPAQTCDLGPILPAASLEGSWSGTITANALKAFSSTGPADINDPAATASSVELPFAVTFGADGTPDKLLFISPPVSVHGVDAAGIPALQAGETATVTLQDRAYEISAREASYTPARMHVVLDTSLVYQAEQIQITTWSEINGTGTGVQTIDVERAGTDAAPVWIQLVEQSVEIQAVHHVRATGGTITVQSWEASLVQASGPLDPQ